MKRLFPQMNGCLNGGYIFCIMAWWLIAFILFPFVITLFDFKDWARVDLTPWAECFYNAVNALVLIRILKEALSDGIFEIQIQTKQFLGTVFAAFGAAAVYILLILHPLFSWMDSPDALSALFNGFPITEMSVLATPAWTLGNVPVAGTLCMTLLTPFAVTGMYYATGFAPVCCRVRWLGYVTVAALLLLPAGFDILWRGNAGYVLWEYLLRLPVHWIACWSYQKTDNIWAPIGTLALVNLGTALMCVPF